MTGGDWLPLEGAGGSSLDWVVVTDEAYGAVGDDTTDDTAAIQAAINATPLNGTCYFPVPAVAYKITSAITLPRPMRLLGAQGFPYALTQGSRVRQATANTSAFVGPTTGSQNWCVEGMSIIGQVGSQTGGAAIESTQSIIVTRVRTRGFQDGLRITSTSASHHAFYSVAENSWFDEASRAGLRLVGLVNNFSWLNCRSNDNDVGIQVTGGVLSLRIFGGALDWNNIAIDVDGQNGGTGQNTAGVLISGLYIEGLNGDTDIRIGNATAVYAVRIESCSFIKPSFTGTGYHIVATNVQGLTIDDCEFTSDDCVNVTSPATGVLYGQNRNRNAGSVTLPVDTVRLDSASVTPSAVADTADVGTSPYLARADHVHDGATAVTVADVRDAGTWEVVVDGNPATAVTTPDGTDWVYGWITA